MKLGEYLSKETIIGIDALGINEEGGGRTSILHYLQILTEETSDWNYVIYLSEYEPTLCKPKVKQVILPFKRGVLSRLFMQIYLPFDVIFRKLDVIHFTKGQASLVPFAKMVLTIHDLTIIHHPGIHSQLSVFYWKRIQPWMARKMHAIFAVSKNTANDIVEYYKISPEKITVIYNTSQFHDYFKNNQTSSSINDKVEHEKDPYILYVGLLALKKNLETLVRAIDHLKSNNKSIPTLFIVGPRYSDSDAGYIIDLIKELNLQDQIIYKGKVSKEDLYQIFKNAMIFVFPSIHEGFGIPCLESMELGVPLIASKTSGIIEVVGDAGILIADYLSPKEWAEAIHSVYQNKTIRDTLISKGYQRARIIHSKYSPKEAIPIYKSLIKSKRNKVDRF